MKLYLSTVIFILNLCFFANAQPIIENQNKFKEVKFFNGDVACLITEKEQQEANEYNIETNYDFRQKSITALLLTKLRILNKAKFDDVLCGLRYFADQFNSNNGNYSDERALAMFQDYTKIIVKLSKDSSYKNDFESKLKNSLDSNVFLNSNIIDLNFLKNIDIELARKIYEAGLIGKLSKSLSISDLNNIFYLYYSYNLIPSNDVKNAIINRLAKSIPEIDFFEIYLSNVNDISYEDLFKKALDQFSLDSENISLRRYVARNPQLKKILESKYVNDAIKCRIVKEYFIQNSYDPEDVLIKDLLKNNITCLDEVIAKYKHFIIPNNKCPYIKIEKHESRDEILKLVSDEFYTKWLSCRNKCSDGDKCIAVTNGNNKNVFINNKYLEDKAYIQSYKLKSWSPSSSIIAKADLLVGECMNNICVEKIENCSFPSILEKIENELKNANLKSCTLDSECKSVYIGLSCTEIAVNNLLRTNGMIAPGVKKNKDYGQNSVSSRYDEITRACNSSGQIENQPMRSCFDRINSDKTEAKCIDKICKIVPSQVL